jgi:predicted TIM-barrel fold metal-dependent hydrolase
VHAHFLPPVYREALRDAGLKTLDGGMPIPEWTAERALAVMNEVGIAAVGSIPALGRRAVPPAEAMQAFARFHYDTALAATPQQIAALRILAPPSQLLYGTDYPFANEGLVRMAEAAFAALPFPPDEREGIRAGNAARLFPALVDRRSPTEAAR